MANLPTSDSRARRFRLRLPLQYRGTPTGEWRSGTTENISVSGVLFRAPEPVKPRTPIEFNLLLPRYLSGAHPVRMFGRGYVVRLAHPGTGPGETSIAGAFLHLMLAPSGAARADVGQHPGVSYRVFNNLAVILGSSELLLDRKDLPPEVLAGIKRLQSAALALSANVRDLAQ